MTFEQIKQEINANLPDNMAQLITARKLRDTMIDLTDTIEDEQEVYEVTSTQTIDTAITNMQSQITSSIAVSEASLRQEIEDAADEVMGAADRAVAAAEEALEESIKYVPQELTNAQKYQARLNIGIEGDDGALDPTKTYINIIVPEASRRIDVRNVWSATNIKNETPGSCFIDFGEGDGDVPITNINMLDHIYTNSGPHTIVLTGLTGLTSNLFFREVTYIKSVVMGNTFTNPGTYLLFAGSPIDSVEFVAETPFRWGVSSYNSIMNQVTKIIVPTESLTKYMNAWYADFATVNKDVLTKKIYPKEPVDYIYRPVTVTVGTGGDYATITEALQYLSQFYPQYAKGGMLCQIKILNGTTISEQIYVDGADYSWITITYEGYDPDSLNYDQVALNIANGTIVFDTTPNYNAVAVDARGFGQTSHDQRGDYTLFRAENGGKLPIIGCVFKLVNPHASIGIAGMVCNRSSAGVVKTLCGFIGFNDGVISNNESSITIREGITMNCTRWGCHARHNGEVSARSVIATGCATLASSSEQGAAVADRVADMDVREAYLSGKVAIRSSNGSTICARVTHILGGGVAGTYLVQADYSGRINGSGITFEGVAGGGYSVMFGGIIDAFSPTGNPTFNVTKNTVTSNGIIFG